MRQTERSAVAKKCGSAEGFQSKAPDRETGGETGIRTQGEVLAHSRFPGVCFKPLSHLSCHRSYSGEGSLCAQYFLDSDAGPWSVSDRSVWAAAAWLRGFPSTLPALLHGGLDRLRSGYT